MPVDPYWLNAVSWYREKYLDEDTVYTDPERQAELERYDAWMLAQGAHVIRIGEYYPWLHFMDPAAPTTGSLAGVSGSIGAMRFNTTSSSLEVYDGQRWQPILGNTNPETWQEWLDYYNNEIIDHVDKRQYMNRRMQERFPGAYQVQSTGGQWQLIFDTPADETWFHLKYE